MAAQQNSGGWRGNRPTKPGSEQPAGPEHGWKQSSRKSSGAASGGSRRSKLRLLFAALVVTVIAALLAILFMPAKRLLTFVVSPSITASSAPAVPLLAALPPAFTTRPSDLNPIELRSGPAVSELNAVLSTISAIKSVRKPDAAIVLWLQILPVPDQRPAAASAENKTPALLLPRSIQLSELLELHASGAPPADAIEPNKLRDQISELLRTLPKAHLLLLVDQPAPLLPLSHGLVQLPVLSNIHDWTKQPGLERLAVVTACDDQQISWPDPGGNAAQTAFAAAAHLGLSVNADSNKNQVLSATEYASFINTDTTRRLQPVLGAAAPQVRISGNTSFILLSELPKAPSPTALTKSSTTVLPELVKTIQQVAQLQADAPWLWLPVRWQQVVDQLRTAEASLAAGNPELAAKLLELARADFATLQTASSQFLTPADPNFSSHQLPHQLLAELPASQRLLQKSPNPNSAAEKSLEIGLDKRAENVPEILTQAETRKQLIENRRLAEVAAAEAFTATDLLQPLLLSHEELQLLSEDRFLVNAQPPAENSLTQQQRFLDAATSFARSRRSAQLLLSQLLQQLPGFIEFAPVAIPSMTETTTPTSTTAAQINSLLRRHLSLTDSQPQEVQRLLDDCRTQLDGQPDTDLLTPTAALVITTRLLHLQLMEALPEPPADPTDATAELSNRSSRLQNLLDQSLQLRSLLLERANAHADRVNTNALDPARLSPEQQLNTALDCRRLLLLPLDSDRHINLLKRTQELEQELLKLAGSATAPATANAAASANTPAEQNTAPPLPARRPAGYTELLWQLQLVTLLPNPSENLTTVLQQFPDQPEQVTSQFLHQAGSALLASWPAQKDRLSSLRSTPELRTADLRTRLLPPLFARQTLPPAPQPEISARYWMALASDYSNFHIERLRASRWVLPTDQSPLAEKGWYARQIELWQASSRSAPPTAANPASPTPPTAPGEPALELENAPPDVLFANNSTPTLELSLRLANPSNRSGIAAFQLLPPLQPDDSARAVILPPAVAVNIAAPNGRERAAFPLALQGGTPRPAPCSDASFLSTWFFRGRSNNVRNITLNPCEALDWSITRAAQPTNSSVQITSLSLGPVAFLLDWSASMKNVDDGGQGNTAPRSEQAAAALQKLVDQQLQAGFVNARKVSLRVFGHRENFSTDGVQQLSPDFDAAFEGFDFPANEPQQQRALGLISMTPLAPAISKRFADVNQRLNKCTPWGWSPLYESIRKCIDTDLQARSGLVVAITDGVPGDGPTPESPEQAKRNSLPALLRSLQNLKGRVQVLILCMVPAETARIEEQLNIDLAKLNLQPADTQLLRSCFLIRTAEDQNLTTEMDNATQPGALTLTNGNAPREPVAGRIDPVNGRGRVVYAADQLDPARDCLVSLGAQRSDSAPLTATFRPLPGGQVLIEADWQDLNRRLLFRHGSATELSVPLRQTSEIPAAPTRLASTGPQKFQPRGNASDLQFQLYLDHDNENFPVALPQELEFVYSAATGVPGTARIQESFESFQGCPAWKINIAGWHPDARIRVRAFWKMNASQPDEVIALPVALKASSPDTSRKLEPANMPPLRLWSNITEDRRLQIRVDPAPPFTPPAPGSHQLDPQSPHSIRISLLERDAADRWNHVPTATSIRRLENGSLLCEFRGDENAPWLAADRDRFAVGLTSLNTRLSGALETAADLQLDQPLPSDNP
ncbi:MAG: hypothetical protein ACKO2L_11350 [Planctomycetaceae bacterium]